jgi:hypothetical protein
MVGNVAFSARENKGWSHNALEGIAKEAIPAKSMKLLKDNLVTRLLIGNQKRETRRLQ